MTTNKKTMIIAVDFDGTIVEHKYPAIGKEIPFAIDTLKKLQEEKHLLVLWTVREGDLLNEAVEFCKSKGLEFYAVNKDYPEETELSEDFSRKLKADLFIDDRNIGGIPDWGIIYRMINEGLTYEQIWAGDDMHQMMRNNKRKNIFLRIGEMIDRK
jgi:hydroxymethylpyrimidine pyrophosphatase-like HAD family hydrolase